MGSLGTDRIIGVSCRNKEINRNIMIFLLQKHYDIPSAVSFPNAIFLFRILHPAIRFSTLLSALQLFHSSGFFSYFLVLTCLAYSGLNFAIPVKIIFQTGHT